jgi:hypothetical protein
MMAQQYIGTVKWFINVKGYASAARQVGTTTEIGEGCKN